MPNTNKEANLPVSPALDVLIAEYTKAQDSAEHHDNLIWTTTSILWGGNLLLLAYVMTVISKTGLGLKIVLTVVAILAVVLAWTARKMALLWNAAMNDAYGRCREIEARLGMRVHTDWGAHWPKGIMKAYYKWLTILFTIVWAVVVLTVWGEGIIRSAYKLT